MADAYIIDAVRTPRGIGKVGKGALAEHHPQHLAATVLKAIAERNKLNTADVDDIIWSTSTQRGKQDRDPLVDGSSARFPVPVDIRRKRSHRIPGGGAAHIVPTEQAKALHGQAPGQRRRESVQQLDPKARRHMPANSFRRAGQSLRANV